LRRQPDARCARAETPRSLAEHNPQIGFAEVADRSAQQITATNVRSGVPNVAAEITNTFKGSGMGSIAGMKTVSKP
jgi:hypothetical protein